MTEDEFAQMVRKGLTSDLTWMLITASEQDRADVAEWLVRAITSTRGQRERRKLERQAATTTLAPQSPEWRQAVADHKRWEAKARGFEQLVIARLRDLGLTATGKPLQKPTLDERQRAHNENMQRQLTHVTDSLADLASMVEAFEGGRASADEVVALLDDLTIPHNGDGTRTLRELLAAKRAARTEGAA